MNDFEQRTLRFSLDILVYCKSKKITIFNTVYISQILRSSSSAGANYREANNGLSYKDCVHRLRIARKEVKETIYWLQILIELDSPTEKIVNQRLQKEAIELMKILSTMIKNKKQIEGEF